MIKEKKKLLIVCTVLVWTVTRCLLCTGKCSCKDKKLRSVSDLCKTKHDYGENSLFSSKTHINYCYCLTFFKISLHVSNQGQRVVRSRQRQPRRGSRQSPQGAALRANCTLSRNHQRLSSILDQPWLHLPTSKPWWETPQQCTQYSFCLILYCLKRRGAF